MTRVLLSAVMLVALLDRRRGGDARAIGLHTQAARYSGKGDPEGRGGGGGVG